MATDEPDAAEEELREAIRRAYTAAAPGGGWAAVRALGAVAFAAPQWAGGFDLGQAAAVVVAEELGCHGACSTYLAEVLAAEWLAAAGPGGAPARLLADLAAGTATVMAIVPPSGGTPVLEHTPQASRVEGTAGWRCATCGPADPTLLLAAQGPAGLVLAAVRSGAGGRAAYDDGGHIRPVVPAGPVDLMLPAPLAARAVTAAAPRAQVRLAAFLAGLTRRAVQEARDHTEGRRQFGSPLSDFQSLRFQLAALWARLMAVRVSVRAAARRQDRGENAELASVDGLALAAELALEACRACMHLHGAAGTYADARPALLYQTARCQGSALGPPAVLWARSAELRATAGAGGPR